MDLGTYRLARALALSEDYARRQIHTYNELQYYIHGLVSEIPELEPYLQKMADCADTYVEIVRIITGYMEQEIKSEE